MTTPKNRDRCKPDTRHIKRGVALPDAAWQEFREEARRQRMPLATWVALACRVLMRATAGTQLTMQEREIDARVP